MKRDPHATMVRRAFENSPEATLSAFNSLWENSLRLGYLNGLWSLSQCWESPQRPLLEQFLLDFFKRADFIADKRDRMRHQLFNELFEHDVLEADKFAWEILYDLSDQSPHAEKERLQCATLLLVNGRRDAWKNIWPMVLRREVDGRKLVKACAWWSGHARNGFAQLSATELEEIYLLLRRLVKPKRDRAGLGMRPAKVRGETAQLRDRVFSYLGERGEPADLQAMERIVQLFPLDDKLRDHLHQARRQSRLRDWQPIAPAQLLDLSRDPLLRQVRNGEELLEVLQASLGRLESKLQSGTPAAVDLWNELKWSQVAKIFADRMRTDFGDTPNLLKAAKQIFIDVKRALDDRKKKDPKKRYPADPLFFLPRDETRLSDYVKRHLDEDLNGRKLIVNREVEVRPAATGVGMRSDLWVGVQTDFGLVVVIIEVKGCWHEEVQTAMETQLRDEYLIPLGVHHGLFLVGWFECEAWCPADTRRDDVPKRNLPAGGSQTLTLEEMRDELKGQANSLSVSGYKIQSCVLDARWPLGK